MGNTIQCSYEYSKELLFQTKQDNICLNLPMYKVTVIYNNNKYNDVLVPMVGMDLEQLLFYLVYYIADGAMCDIYYQRLAGDFQCLKENKLINFVIEKGNTNPTFYLLQRINPVIEDDIHRILKIFSQTTFKNKLLCFINTTKQNQGIKQIYDALQEGMLDRDEFTIL